MCAPGQSPPARIAATPAPVPTSTTVRASMLLAKKVSRVAVPGEMAPIPRLCAAVRAVAAAADSGTNASAYAEAAVWGMLGVGAAFTRPH